MDNDSSRKMTALRAAVTAYGEEHAEGAPDFYETCGDDEICELASLFLRVSLSRE